MDNLPTTSRGGVGKALITIIAILAVTAIAILAILRDRIVNYPQWQVSVSGQGKVSYEPDLANVTLGVQVDRAAQPQDALRQLNEKINQVLAAAKNAGIPEADIQTQSYSLYPQYDYIENVSTLAGYTANQQLIIRVRDIKKDKDAVSRVIAQTSQAGVNQIVGITFDVSNLNDLKQEARLKALSDATAKAANQAQAAGVELKRVVGWWENLVQAPGIPTPYLDGKGGMDSGPSVPSGTQEVVVEIGLTYLLK